MSSFEQLVESRKEWLVEVLEPWCRSANRADLRRAELEWIDLAGKVDPQATLWIWAWGRFPALIDPGIRGIDESWPVTLTLKSGQTHTGYPDSRQSEHGELVLVGTNDAGATVALGPYSIDDVADVARDRG